MIRVNGNSLIIEIKCTDGRSPLSTLGEMQSGLVDLMGIIDYKDAPKDSVAWSLHQLNFLMREMMVSMEQFEIINAKMNDNKIFTTEFNTL